MPLHKSVLLKEIVEYLDLEKGKTIVDGTLGAGGHAEAILEKISPGGRLIGFDKDSSALFEAENFLSHFGNAFMTMHSDFRYMAKRLKEMHVHPAQGILLDLGVSSMQLYQATRGFSFRFDGPLDMRMNQADSLTAKQIVNSYSKQDLLDILWNFGQERFAKRIVEKILAARQRMSIESTAQLAAIISEAVPGFYRHGRLHPATKTFQALRIAVNQEMEALQDFLGSALDCLSPSGRLVIISFHSNEDRLVKNAFKNYAKEKLGFLITKKPITPGLMETHDNPRARSAKMRVFQKI